jgi:hypothetical protein
LSASAIHQPTVMTENAVRRDFAEQIIVTAVQKLASCRRMIDLGPVLREPALPFGGIFAEVMAKSNCVRKSFVTKWRSKTARQFRHLFQMGQQRLFSSVFARMPDKHIKSLPRMLANTRIACLIIHYTIQIRTR